MDRQCNTDIQQMERDTATSHPPLLGIAIFCPQKLGSQKRYFPCLGANSIRTHTQQYLAYTHILVYTRILAYNCWSCTNTEGPKDLKI